MSVNAPTGVMTLLDTELRLLLAALDAYHPVDGANQEIRHRAIKKLRQELEIKERPFVARKVEHEKQSA